MKRWKDMDDEAFERRIAADTFWFFGITVLGMVIMATNMLAGIVFMVPLLLLLIIDISICTQKFVRNIRGK